MPRYVRYMVGVMMASLTALSLFLAARYVVPAVFSWLKYLLVVLTPFLIALILTSIMEPMVCLIQSKVRLSRPLSVGVTMLFFFGGLGALLTLLVIRLIAELTELSEAFPKYAGELQLYLEDVVERSRLFYHDLPPRVIERFEQTVNLPQIMHMLTDSIQNWVIQAANFLLHAVTVLPGVLLILVVSLVATYFISRDRPAIARLWLRVVPEPWGPRSLEIGRKVSRAFVGYIRAQLILVSITMVLSTAGLSFIGSKYAITLGLLIGFFDLVPVLGPGTVYVPWALWAFINGQAFMGLKLLLLYLLVMVVRAVLEAKVLAVNLGLHPLAVLLAMYVGLKTIGVVGLVLGPILIITVQAALKAGITVYREN